MSLSRRQILKAAGLSGLAAACPGLGLAQKAPRPEKTDVAIAVGGKGLVYYLPLTIAEQKGFFKDEGLNVKIANFAGGSKALQAVVGGSADICSGAFEHTINLQVRKQFFRAFVLQGRAPMIVLAGNKKTLAGYKSPADLKGKRIGVTAPGSSTNMLVRFFLDKHGLKDSDVSIIGVGGGAGAVSALRAGQIDALSNLDPVISLLDSTGDIFTIADTRTLKDTQAVFGGPMPAGCLYTAQKYIDENPGTVQALTNAMVKADKWIQAAGPDEIMKTVPKSYLLGKPDVYKLALTRSFEGLSPDGRIDPLGVETSLKAQAAYIAGFKVDAIDLSKCWTNAFTDMAAKA